MTTARAFLKRHTVIGALLAVLAAAGCGTDSDSGVSSNPDATTSVSPSAAAEPTAADGADYESCGDGECEVFFSEPVEFTMDGPQGQFTVGAAIEDDDGIKVDVTRPNGYGTGAVLHSPDCTLAADGNDGMSLSCAEDGEELPEPEAGGIVVHLLELTEDTAVIRAVLG
ncbi:hypothetical protein GCM10027447_33450 [Glycomyces halotolerans]